MLFVTFGFLIFGVCQILCKSFDELKDQQDYLMKYGYIDYRKASPFSSSLLSEDVLKNAIRKFQRIAGLDETGVMNNSTKVMMDMPRCGVSDSPQMISHRRKRYALYGTKWKKNELKYKFVNYTKDLSIAVIEKTLEKAFQYWQNASGLTFKKSTLTAEIDISFHVKNHGDDDDFDGRGGTLAHAFFPSPYKMGGDVHFDNDEEWTLNEYRGTNLLQVAVHELGHSLGLSHSDVDSSIMAPFYKIYDPKMKLHNDDIRGIQALYGPPKSQNTELSPTKTTTNLPKTLGGICNIGTPDAIVPFKDFVFVFKGTKMYVMDEMHDHNAKAVTAANIFPSLPDNVDTAFSIKSYVSFLIPQDHLYFFKGKKVWKYLHYERPFGFKLLNGYPKEISNEFKDIPSDIDAGFVWDFNGYAYLFKGENYYRITKANKMASQYPRLIKNWNMMFNKVDVVFNYPSTSPSETFFVSGDQIYKYDENNDKTAIGFPKPFSWFLGCTQKGSFKESLASTWNGAPVHFSQISFLIFNIFMFIICF